MACPEAWIKLQPVIKIVFLSTIIAFCSLILGFATPVWVSASGAIPIQFIDREGTHTGSVGFLVASRVFACFSLIASFVGIAMVFWFACVSKTDNGRLLMLSMIMSFVTGALIIITVAIFGGEVKSHLSFSFAMMCIAAIVYTVNGVLFLVYIGTGRR
ncbi:unnamed protein product [Mytilus edulis]|uniref:Uncharacterized protein n=1 Tax=Mytilus edulis TaxID=6550 RepID=A0A8S3TBM8_MYTED|nr:unnamed protein product [Mytilus edulis]